WGFNLLLSVWSGLRQGLRGGSLAAASSSVFGLMTVSMLGGTVTQVGPFQGVMLAQCSTALLVGASAGWIRASEARYRQVVGHIPLVLYSAQLPRGLKVFATAKGARPNLHPRSDPDFPPHRKSTHLNSRHSPTSSSVLSLHKK